LGGFNGGGGRNVFLQFGLGNGELESNIQGDSWVEWGCVADDKREVCEWFEWITIEVLVVYARTTAAEVRYEQ